MCSLYNLPCCCCVLQVLVSHSYEELILTASLMLIVELSELQLLNSLIYLIAILRQKQFLFCQKHLSPSLAVRQSPNIGCIYGYRNSFCTL